MKFKHRHCRNHEWIVLTRFSHICQKCGEEKSVLYRGKYYRNFYNCPINPQEILAIADGRQARKLI